MKILLLTQWFDPEPTFKGMAFAKQLKEDGHDVEVITGFPNYPGGKIYDGYKQGVLVREVINDVLVNRVPLYPSHDGSGLKRAFNYISFAITSCLCGLFMAKKADVIYAYHPPLTVGLSAVLIGFFRRIPVVYDIQDMWPDTLKATGMLNNPRVLALISKVCFFIYRHAAALVVLSPGFKRLLLERGVPEKKIHLIYNWCDEAALTISSYSDNDIVTKMQGYFNIVFAGTMGKAQALEVVLQAAVIVAEQNKKIRFVFVGGGIEVERLKDLANQLCLQNVLFLPRMPMSKIGQVLDLADVLLVHLRKDPLFAITIPSKTQAYMAVGKPLLMAVEGDAANLVVNSGAGLIAEPENAESIAQASLKFAGMSSEQLQLLGQKAEQYYKNELSLGIGTKKFIEVFHKVMPK